MKKNYIQLLLFLLENSIMGCGCSVFAVNSDMDVEKLSRIANLANMFALLSLDMVTPCVFSTGQYVAV